MSRRGRSLGLALVLAASPGVARAQRPNDLRAEALRLYQAGLYRDAIPLLDAILARKPRDITAHIKRGNSHLFLSRPDLALADFDAVVRFNPYFAPAYIDRGVANLMLNRLDAAGADFVRSLRLYSSPIGTTDPAVTAYIDTSWNVATPYVPLNLDTFGTQRALAHSGLAQVAHRLGRDADALVEYDMSLRLNPGDPNSHTGRGDALLALGQPGAALAEYDAALRLVPIHARAMAGRAEALARLGESRRALDDLGRALALNPEDSHARRVRASLLSGAGRNEDALADLDAVLRIDPRDAGALKDRGGVRVRMGQPDRALADLDAALRIDPRRIGALVNRGAAFAALGRPERAIRDLDAALALDPANVVARCNRGENASRLGRHDEAVRDFEEALRLAPNLAPARAGLVRALGSRGHDRRARGDLDGGIADFTAALALDPRDADAHAGRGWTRLIAGRDGADGDARAFLNLVQAEGPSAAYIAILGALGARRAGNESEANRFLAEAPTLATSWTWPAPILRYLRRTATAESLLAAAGNSRETAEAHAFLGIDLLATGHSTEAVEHLRRASATDAGSAVALELAREALRRIEGRDALPAPLP